MTLNFSSTIRFTAAFTGLLALTAAIGCVGCGGHGVALPSMTKVLDKALWVANGANVVEFIPSQLTTGTADPAPHLAINSSVFGAPQGVAFDADGNLWVIDGGTVAAGGTIAPALFQFSAAQLANLATVDNPAPAITIRSASFTFPQQAVFDGKGNLWVSDNGANAIFVFAPGQLQATSAKAAPSISVTSSTAFNGPLGIAFDANGNLYVANNAGTTIERFSAGSLPTSAGTHKIAPNQVLQDDGAGSIQAPWGLAFDAEGDLWSSNANAPNTLVEFTPAQLATGGNPTPAVTLKSVAVAGSQSLVAPNGIAFDNLGGIAAASSAAPFGIAAFPKTQLVPANAGEAPKAFLVGNTTTLNAPAGVAFGPVVQ
jgi:sugar lactone lactonase YvrE